MATGIRSREPELVTAEAPLVLEFGDPRCEMVSLVGEKNAALSWLLRETDVHTLNGFALTTEAHQEFLRFDPSLTNWPTPLRCEIVDAYERLLAIYGNREVAVRCATCEACLHVWDEDELLAAIRHCFLSSAEGQAVSVGVQPMVRSGECCSGTIVVGSREVSVRSGLDEWTVFRPKIDVAPNPIIERKVREETTALSDAEVLRLASWAIDVENRRPSAGALTWAKDGLTGELVVLGLGQNRTLGRAKREDEEVGLLRMERLLKVHPLAVCHPELVDTETLDCLRTIAKGEDLTDYFVRTLAEGVGRIAADFYPKPVFARTSDFHQASLLGGDSFDPIPILRGASRYLDPRYAEAFALECRALLRARRDMGLDNIRLAIPLCRTPEEGAAVLDRLAARGLQHGRFGLQVYAMCELSCHVSQAAEFLSIFDGYVVDVPALGRAMASEPEALREAVGLVVATARGLAKPVVVIAPDTKFSEWLTQTLVLAPHEIIAAPSLSSGCSGKCACPCSRSGQSEIRSLTK